MNEQTERDSYRILVIDDELILLRLLKRALGLNHEVVTASSGRDALKIIESDRNFDFILCDILMADISGMELYGMIASRRPSLCKKFIFSTGGSINNEMDDFLSRPEILYVTKPFDLAELEALMRKRRPAHSKAKTDK